LAKKDERVCGQEISGHGWDGSALGAVALCFTTKSFILITALCVGKNSHERLSNNITFLRRAAEGVLRWFSE